MPSSHDAQRVVRFGFVTDMDHGSTCLRFVLRFRGKLPTQGADVPHFSNSTLSATVFLIVVIHLAGSVAAFAGDTLRTLLLSGQQALGLQPDVTVGSFSRLDVGPRDGSFTFGAGLSDANGSPPFVRSVWTSSSDGVSLVARYTAVVGSPVAWQAEFRPETAGRYNIELSLPGLR